MTSQNLVFKYFLLKPSLKQFIKEKDQEVESKESLLWTASSCILFAIFLLFIAVIRG